MGILDRVYPRKEVVIEFEVDVLDDHVQINGSVNGTSEVPHNTEEFNQVMVKLMNTQHGISTRVLEGFATKYAEMVGPLYFREYGPDPSLLSILNEASLNVDKTHGRVKITLQKY